MSRQNAIKIPERIGRTILELRAEELRLKRVARNANVGKNLDNAMADLDVPFPWMDDLRIVSPQTVVHSYLMPYWYRYAQRWVLYDVWPVELIFDDQQVGTSGLTGKELKEIMEGVRPTDRPDFDDWQAQPVSDLQHEMWRRWKGFARPFWALEGENGGHQIQFSPQQADALCRMGLPPEPPVIGSLPACPFDNRAIGQLRHLSRLHQLEDSIDRLRKSGSPEAAAAAMEKTEREIREAEMAFVEAQMRPVVDAAQSLRHRSEHASELIQFPDGTASRAKDAYEEYRETGNWSL